MGILGIDTSCYRTSLAFVENGEVLSDRRILLSVKKGERGLRQSEGLFQHIQNLPILTEQLRQDIGDRHIDAVCVSTRPRPLEDSYMPVFTAGSGLAREIASINNILLLQTSHQQGHVRAAMIDTELPDGEFLAVHMSGGTTEVLHCDQNLSIRLLGGSKDLHAGQLVDRVGVKLGLSFPSGPEMEELAGKGTARSLLAASVEGASCNLSGAEAQIMRLIDGGLPPEDAAAEVYSFLARTLSKMLVNAAKETNVNSVLLAGGVCASARLKVLMRERLHKMGSNIKTYWAKPILSGDNAVGVAMIGYDQYK